MGLLKNHDGKLFKLATNVLSPFKIYHVPQIHRIPRFRIQRAVPAHHHLLTINNVQLIRRGTNCTLYIVHCTLFLVREMKRMVEER